MTETLVLVSTDVGVSFPYSVEVSASAGLSESFVGKDSYNRTRSFTDVGMLLNTSR